MLHGSVGFSGVKTNARSRERTSVGGGVISSMKYFSNAFGVKRILTVHSCLVCVIVVKIRHARSKTFGFPYIKLRFLVIFML